MDRDSTSRGKRVFLTRRGIVATSDLVYHYSIHNPTETLRSYLAAIAQLTKTSPRGSLEAAPPLITRRNFYAYKLSFFLINLRILYTGGTTVDVGQGMAAATDVSDWIATPGPLNDKKSGVRAIFSTDNSIVQRGDPWRYVDGCVSYTRGPLPPGQVWQVTVLETSTTKWGYGYDGMVSGCVLSLLYHHMMWCVSTYKTSEDSFTGCIYSDSVSVIESTSKSYSLSLNNET